MGRWIAAFHRPIAEFWQCTPHEVFAAFEGFKFINTPPDKR